MQQSHEIRQEFVKQIALLDVAVASTRNTCENDQDSMEWRSRVIIADLTSHLPGFDELGRSQLREETKRFWNGTSTGKR